VVTVKTADFWDVKPYNLTEVHRRFRESYCLHHQMVINLHWWWRHKASHTKRQQPLQK